jgi:DNA-directed RNA polymerase specialized sigma24 family protein
MVAVLAKLDSFAGRSRFTTWVYKFALLEAGVKARRRAWQDREVPLDDAVLRDAAPTAQQTVEDAELLRAVPGMAAHLEGCPACREDYESLLALVRADEQGAPTVV